LYSQSDYKAGNFVIEPPPERAWIKDTKKIISYQIINDDSLLIQSINTFNVNGLWLTSARYFYEEDSTIDTLKWEFTYYENKWIKKVIPSGKNYIYYYNTEGNVFKILKWDYKYDTTITCCYQYSNQNLTSLVNPNGDTLMLYTYNHQNQLLSINNKYEELKRYEYDENGNLIKEFNTSENYLERTHQYDSLNRLIETKAFVDSKYLLGIHSYQYDNEGRVIEYTELKHNKRVFKILLYQYQENSAIIEIYYKRRKRKERKPDEIYIEKYEYW